MWRGFASLYSLEMNTEHPISILPSILAADMANLETDVRRALDGGADGLHVDVMDGHFVPNLSMGPAVVEALRKALGPDVYLHVHLMITDPARYVGNFIKAGADTVLIHIESNGDIPACLSDIRRQGARAGITLNPGTPADAVRTIIEDGAADELLCMTVHPGFGGQSFIADVLPKISQLREWAPITPISVDGGIDADTAPRTAEHGANVMLAGTSLFKANDMQAAIAAMRRDCAARFGAARA